MFCSAAGTPPPFTPPHPPLSSLPACGKNLSFENQSENSDRRGFAPGLLLPLWLQQQQLLPLLLSRSTGMQISHPHCFYGAVNMIYRRGVTYTGALGFVSECCQLRGVSWVVLTLFGRPGGRTILQVPEEEEEEGRPPGRGFKSAQNSKRSCRGWNPASSVRCVEIFRLMPLWFSAAILMLEPFEE